MSLFPIVQRELNLASRRAGTYWLRFGAAALVSGISVTLALGHRQSPSRLGQNLFAVLSILAFAYCLLAGIRYTADALSEERREGTLGLLFLTDLRGFDVVVGKLAVTSLHAFFGLLAIFPMLGLPLLLGGVTGIEFWRVTLVLLNTLMFSLSIGLLVSTFGTNERGVMLKTLFLLLLFAGGLPIAWKGATRWADIRLFDLILLLPSPIYAFKMSAAGIFGTRSSDFWPSMLTVLATSTACVSTASILLPRIFQERGRASQHLSEGFLYRLRFGSPKTRQRLRIRLLNRNPFAWLVSRDRSLKIGLLVLVIAIACFGFWTAEPRSAVFASPPDAAFLTRRDASHPASRRRGVSPVARPHRPAP
jgi:hypothetical protein